jgi:ClpP class serine protease
MLQICLDAQASGRIQTRSRRGWSLFQPASFRQKFILKSGRTLQPSRWASLAVVKAARFEHNGFRRSEDARSLKRQPKSDGSQTSSLTVGYHLVTLRVRYFMARRTLAKSTSKNRHSGAFLLDSPFIKLRREVSQDSSLRRGLLRKIEAHYRAKAIVFFTSFQDENTQIIDLDAEMLESVLSVEHDGGKLLVILNSPGGQALAAERIANILRAYSDDNYEVIIPHMAKSAATMICFGAAKIHMSKTAELGPVDPQLTFKDDTGRVVWISAQEYVRSYQKLFEEATSDKPKRIEPYIQQLNRYDSRYIEKLLSAQALSKDISIRLLKSGMMSSLPEAKIEEKIQVFLSQVKTSSHGRMINSAGVKQCGLKVEQIGLRSRVWNALWEYYVRADYAVTNICKKIIESTESGLHG